MPARFLIAVSLLASCLANADPVETAETVSQWRQANEQQIVDRFADLLSIPNVAADTANVRKNATHISEMLRTAGMEVELLELDGANPVVFARRDTPAPGRR